jgi:tetratricopeptide (TPR) repeat protein
MKDEKTKKDEYQKAMTAYTEAVKEFRKGKFDKSAETLRVFVEKFPAEREMVDRAKTYLAISLEKLKESKAAVTLKTAGDFFYYAVFKMNSGERAEAEQLLDKALKLGPEDARIHFLLAGLYCVMGRTDAGLESLRKAIQLDKSYRILAQNEADFEPLWDDKRFRLITRVP